MLRCPVSSLFTRKRYLLLRLRRASSFCCATAETDLSSDDSAAAPELTDYSELRHRMHGHATSGSIGKALEVLNFMKENVPGKPTVYDYNALIGCYFRSGDAVVDELREVYTEMKTSGPSPNLLTYYTMLNGIICIGRLEDVILILKEMIDDGFLPSYTILMKLFKKLLKLASVAEAAGVLEIMWCLNFNPSQYCLGALIQGLCKVGMVGRAYSVFSTVSGKGYFCRGELYNPILWALCKSEQVYEALAFFGLLEKKGFVHTVYSYAALAYGFSKGRLWEEAFHCLGKMENIGCKPNLVTYTVVVKFLCDDGKVDEALSLMGKMEEEGSTADLVMYNIIIRELSHQGRVSELGDLFRVMDQKGLSPDKYTHAALTDCMLKGGRVEFANKLLLSRGCTVDNVVFNIYLHSMCLRGKSKEALCAMMRMMNKGLRPTTVSYNIILKGLCKEKDLDKALKFLLSFRWPDDGPDMISFNTILSAACKLRNSSMIREIVRQMGCYGIQFDVVSLTCFIQYLTSIGKVLDFLELVDDMLSKGQQPNTVTFNTLLAGLCKNQPLGRAKIFFDFFKGIGVLPDTTTYNILLRASIREGNDALVYELSRDMNVQKLKPDMGTFVCFIYSLCKGGKISVTNHLRNQLWENGIPPNIFVYNTIMRAMFTRGMILEILSLFKDMAIEGCEPNEGTFDVLRQAKMNGWMKSYPRTFRILEFVMRGYPS